MNGLDIKEGKTYLLKTIQYNDFHRIEAKEMVKVVKIYPRYVRFRRAAGYVESYLIQDVKNAMRGGTLGE